MKYLSRCLRLNNNNITELHDLKITVGHFLAAPSQLAWLDLSFNTISHIDQVSFLSPWLVCKCACTAAQLSFFFLPQCTCNVCACVPGFVRAARTACAVSSRQQHFYSVRGGQAGSATTPTHHHSTWKCYRNQQGLQVETFFQLQQICHKHNHTHTHILLSCKIVGCGILLFLGHCCKGMSIVTISTNQ